MSRVLPRVCRSQELTRHLMIAGERGPGWRLAAGGHPTRGSEDTGAGVIITLTCADQGGVETPSSQYWVPFILNNYY